MGLPGKPCLLLLLSLLVINVTSISCASDCNCITGTFSCQVCLQYYYQVYSLEKKECQCLPGFTSSAAIVDYCHPFNCQLSSDWGCATCHAHATIHFEDDYQYYNCTCDSGYYLNLTDYLCYCRSISSPSLYYRDIILDKCMVCPTNCICNVTGCIQCDVSTMRAVVSNTYSSTCYCKKPNIEINGSCSCALGCVCSPDGTIDCGPSSNRHLVVDQWVCKHPYVSNNSVCQCQEPYTIINTLGYDQCVCKSKTNYSMYYQANGTCYLCGLNCTCDYTGCVSCGDFSAYINYEACTCNSNYVFVYPNCLCLQPYQRHQDSQSGAFYCRCLSYRLSEYYSNPDENFCDVCPFGCNCDSTGCHGCSDPIRVYRTLSGFSICECGVNSVEVIGRCKCLNLFQFDSITSSCKCRVDPLIVYFDSDLGNCNLCPIGCTCNETGCFSCINPANRAIVVNSQNVSTCYCADIFVGVDGSCVCPEGYVLTSGKCQCSTPYYLDANNNCSCMSDSNPTLYYFDDFQDKCEVCPQGCICNSRGCTDCGSDFFRTIKYSFTTMRYRCPCLQNMILVGGYCTVCMNNSYPEYLGDVINITCIPCTQCHTCNRFGCITCPENMDLVNSSCVCNNQTLVNKDGICKCPSNQYLSQGNCKMCPLQCSTCIQMKSNVTCTSCDLDGNRQDLPFQDCPCVQGFMESPVPSTYCCSVNCETCDENGCLTCPPFTYRVLQNNSCLCGGAFTQDNNGICICSSGSYLLNQGCFKCPAQCKTCMFNTTSQSVVCSQCNSGTNRDIKSSNCDCLDNFSETRPINSPFCYATHCTQIVAQCTKCEDPWEIDLTLGYCVCQDGYWIDSSNDNSQCLNCNIKGCLNCINQFLCKQCDQTQQYYLVNTTCIKVNQIHYIEAQTNIYNIIIQSPVTQRPFLLSFAAELLPIRSKSSVSLQPSVKLQVLMSELDLNGSLITLRFRNIPKTLTNVIISFVIQSSNKSRDSPNDPQSGIQGLYGSSIYNLKFGTIYSDDTFDRLNSPAKVGLYVFVLVAMLMGLGFYVWGYKHNQICFFMQTMSLSAFTTRGQNMDAFMFLYNIRFSYYNFSPDNAFSALVPSNYIETSTGNYRLLNIDANIVRNIGVPFILAICTALIALILRVFHFLTKNKPLVKPAGLAILYKKLVYRVIEFFYKTLMYPLVYFCIQTFFDWNTRKVYIQEGFKQKCNQLSIVVISLYFLVTCYQFFWEVTSKFNRIENLKQFVNTVLASVIIVNSVDRPNIRLLLIVIFVSHQLLYVKFKSERIIGYMVINIMRAVIVSCQLVCVVLLVNIFFTPLVVMICLTILLKMGLLSYKVTVDRHYDMISKLTSFSLNESSDEFSFRDIRQENAI